MSWFGSWWGSDDETTENTSEEKTCPECPVAEECPECAIKLEEHTIMSQIVTPILYKYADSTEEADLILDAYIKQNRDREGSQVMN